MPGITGYKSKNHGIISVYGMNPDMHTRQQVFPGGVRSGLRQLQRNWKSIKQYTYLKLFSYW